MKTLNTTKSTKRHFLMLFLSSILMVALIVGCNAPSGAEGPRGPQGEQGPQGAVGPAGEDGSEIYAGDGAPADSIGIADDYYLDQQTGSLYGPKGEGGWNTNPIIVLMGEDGQDGTDGADGNVIHADDGPPDEQLGNPGDFYLDKTNYELYGPKASIAVIGTSFWGTPINLKGADGNANVTRYIFAGHDFDQENRWFSAIDINRTEMRQSAWLVYLVEEIQQGAYSILYYYSVPGSAGYSATGSYSVAHYHSDYDTSTNLSIFNVYLDSGTGVASDQIEIVRIRANYTDDRRPKRSSLSSAIPDHLDTSDYEAVAEYYGFGGR